jgi:hypothetical protein
VQEQVPEFYDLFSALLAVTSKHAHTSIQIMLRYLLAFFLGALTVTGVIVGTGASTGGLVLLGFLAAIGLCAVFTFVIGLGRLSRFLLAISGERQWPMSTPRRTQARRSEVEQEVLAALVSQGATRAAASRATSEAAARAPQEFEQLFRAAVALLSSSRKTIGSPAKSA